MVRAVPWLLCAACWSSPAPAPPVIENVAEAAPAPRRCPPHRVSGSLYEKEHPDEPLIGATVVLSGRNVEVDDERDVDITDEFGHFSLVRRPGIDRITVYYADAMFAATLPAEACKLVARLPLGLGTSGETVDLVFEPTKKR